MPCVLFTFHAYGSWLPDRPQGFVHWRDGLQPRDEKLAEAYRSAMSADAAAFDATAQRTLIAALRSGATFQRYRLHAVACDQTHVHVLASWRDDRSPAQLSAPLKTNLTRRLNAAHGQRKWLAKGASKQPVRDPGHFDHLIGVYLPRHRGWKWEESRGEFLRVDDHSAGPPAS